MKSKILLLILLLALLLRFYFLGKVPVSMYWDEAAIGYNAYTIANFGVDEYGIKSPLFFKSFDDYKLPGIVYLTAVSVKFLGLNEWSVRFPSALLSLFTILITYLLIREITNSEKISLLASFLLAISPWYLQFSRAAFEASDALLFLIIGIYLLFKSKGKVILFPLSMFFLVICLYFYRTFHIFIPLLLIIVLPFVIKKKNILVYILGLVVFICLSTPVLYKSFFSDQNARINQVSIFSTQLPQKKIVYAIDFLKGYIQHFSSDFLFKSGDSNQRHSTGFVGEMYWWESGLLVLGLLFLLNKKQRKCWVGYIWLFLAPISAALSTPVPHALRAIAMLPMLQLFTAVGLYRIKKLALIFVPITSIVLFYYLNGYYNVWANASSASWADGYKQLVMETTRREINYDKVLVTGHYWQPYIYYLFYTRNVNSKYIFGPTGWDKGGHSEELRGVDFKKYTKANKLLIALSPEEYQASIESLKVLTRIYDHNGKEIFVIAEN